MQAYIAAASTMHIPANIHFYQRSFESGTRSKKNSHHCRMEIPKPREWIDKAERDKLETQETVEELRQGYTAMHQTFEKQLKLERLGESDAMMKMMAST